LGVSAALAVTWGLMMRRFGGSDVYAVMGPFSLAVIGIVGILVHRRGDALWSWIALKARAAWIGLGVGVAMTLTTYALFHMAVVLVPPLDAEVEGLYALTRVERLPLALACTLLIIVAEELLWRGLMLDELERLMPRAAAQTLSVLSYGLAQLGSGSLVVFALAVVCGSIWMLERRFAGSLLAPLLSHLIWTPIVILVWPVT